MSLGSINNFELTFFHPYVSRNNAVSSSTIVRLVFYIVHRFWYWNLLVQPGNIMKIIISCVAFTILCEWLISFTNKIILFITFQGKRNLNSSYHFHLSPSSHLLGDARISLSRKLLKTSLPKIKSPTIDENFKGEGEVPTFRKLISKNREKSPRNCTSN